MPSQWGKHLGVVQLHLAYNGKTWSVDKDKTVVQARATQTGTKTFVEPDAEVAALVRAEHEATIAYVKTPVGRSAFRMTSYFADVGDPSAIEVVNRALLLLAILYCWKTAFNELMDFLLFDIH